MKYTYKIDSFNALEETLGVVYLPEDPTLLSHFKRLTVEDVNQTDIDKLIIANAPVELWQLEMDKRASDKRLYLLVGKESELLDGEATVTERTASNERVPVIDIANTLRQHLKQEAETLLRSHTAKYTAAEVESWEKLLTQAHAVTRADTVSDTDFIKRMADARGLPVTEFAQKVIAKHADYVALKEDTAISIREREAKITELLTQYDNKEIGRMDVLIAFEELPLFQPTTEA